MTKKPGDNVFTATNAQRILSFLAQNPGKELLGSEIQRATSISRAGVYIALRELNKHGVVRRTKRGKFMLYAIEHDDATVKQFKILNSVVSLKPLLSALKPLAAQVVLYGSAARGEDTSDSDIDLFILAGDTRAVEDLLSSAKLKRKLQAVVRSPAELAEFRGREKTFMQEVERGITLWQKKE